MAVDIKQLCDYSEKIRNVNHILTETLGTTTSYSFLEDTLRPYVKRNLKEYILNHWNDDELAEIVKSIRTQAELELKEGWVGAIAIPEGNDGDATKEAVISYALGQMDGSFLESLNRLIVKDGYSKGQLKGHVFPDVLPAFKKWTEEGKKIYMYSSGTEMSQQCLMSNSVDGDISKLISGCFESSEFPGAKSESFRELCKKVDSPADKVAFLTHDAATACAAHKAGLVVIMLSREGNSYIGNCTRENFPVITSFEDISKQICGKRKQAPDEVENTEGKRAKLEEDTSEKVAEPEKPEEKKDEASSEPKAVEETADEDVAKEVSSEEKTSAETEEKMEVDEDTEGKVEKAEDATEIKIVVTPPVGEVSKIVEKVGEEVSGAPQKLTEAEVEVEKKDEKESKSEASVDQVDEKVEENVPESKEEKVESKEVEDKVVVEDVKTEAAKAEVEDLNKDENSALEVKVDEKTNEEQVNKTASPEGETAKENGVSEAKTIENGDGAVSGEEGLEKKEVNSNGVTHVNGEEAGDAGKKLTEPEEKGTENIVAKKKEKDEAQIEVTTEAAKESA